MKKKELIGAVEDCAVSVKNLEEKLNDISLEHVKMHINYSELLESISVIESLITQNFVDNPAYAAVVLIPYRGKPTFIKVANDASEVTMTWDAYEHSVRFSTENM